MRPWTCSTALAPPLARSVSSGCSSKRAAQAGLHHALAARLLEQLTAADPDRLETLALPIRVNEDGTVVTRPALDLYVEHLLVLERRQAVSYTHLRAHET